MIPILKSCNSWDIESKLQHATSQFSFSSCINCHVGHLKLLAAWAPKSDIGPPDFPAKNTWLSTPYASHPSTSLEHIQPNVRQKTCCPQKHPVYLDPHTGGCPFPPWTNAWVWRVYVLPFLMFHNLNQSHSKQWAPGCHTDFWRAMVSLIVVWSPVLFSKNMRNQA